MISISLPWPPRSLHPNSREHWGTKARATKKARSDAWAVARSAGLRRGDPDIPGDIKVTVAFNPPRKSVDEDGVLSSCKAYLDGISDALGVNDNRFKISIRREAPIPGGAVRIEISEAV